jgi:hypothetical protein
MLAQLCHMLAAGQSAQVPQEDKQQVTLFLQPLAQRDLLSIYCTKREVRGVLA